MEIIKYHKKHEHLLFDMLVEEGDEWAVYHNSIGREKYIDALESSTTYIVSDGTKICGYIRCREDDGFGVYIYDLLVGKSHRGNQLGKLLMEHVYRNFPDQPVYVMSDVDTYYNKLGYHKVGSIFEVKL